MVMQCLQDGWFKPTLCRCIASPSTLGVRNVMQLMQFWRLLPLCRARCDHSLSNGGPNCHAQRDPTSGGTAGAISANHSVSVAILSINFIVSGSTRNFFALKSTTSALIVAVFLF